MRFSQSRWLHWFLKDIPGTPAHQLQRRIDRRRALLAEAFRLMQIPHSVENDLDARIVATLRNLSRHRRRHWTDRLLF